MEEEIFNKILEAAPQMKEQDLDSWVLPGVIVYFEPRFHKLAKKAYDDYNIVPDSFLQAFKHLATIELRKGLNTFIFNSCHWETDRSLISYLWTVLHRLSDKIKLEATGLKKVAYPICLLCKLNKQREFLFIDCGLLKCWECCKKLTILEDKLVIAKKNQVKSDIFALSSEVLTLKALSLHSKKGYRCNECDNFIPDSCKTEFGMSCPYPNCIFIGQVSDLSPMIHPSTVGVRRDISLNVGISDDPDSPTQQDNVMGDNIHADTHLELKQRNKIELEVLLEVIKEQKESIDTLNFKGTATQKQLMYQAIQNLVEIMPEDMISYLVYRKYGIENPIQVKILQEYIKLVEEYLPFTINVGNESFEITDILDPALKIFDGVSEYESQVNFNHFIPNETKEIYIGSKEGTNYGPFFIGKLVLLEDDKGNNLLNDVEYYTFRQIKINKNILPETKVKVRHYRIFPHYEMQSMILVQRVKKKIIDKVAMKLKKMKL